MNRHHKASLGLALGAAALITLGACSDRKSYADLLNDENKAVNYFLANQNVILDPPADSIFQTGTDAPYYRMDPEGNVYMQVINPGRADRRVRNDELVYFRFTRWNLNQYEQTDSMGTGQGNAVDVSVGSASFRYGNYTLSSSSQWGAGLQTPLAWLGMDCEVNLVIKSQYGVSSEISNVIPYLWNVRYYNAISD